MCATTVCGCYLWHCVVVLLFVEWGGWHVCICLATLQEPLLARQLQMPHVGCLSMHSCMQYVCYPVGVLALVHLCIACAKGEASDQHRRGVAVCLEDSDQRHAAQQQCVARKHATHSTRTAFCTCSSGMWAGLPLSCAVRCCCCLVRGTSAAVE